MRKFLSALIISIIVCLFFYLNTFFIPEAYTTDQITKENRDISKDIVLLTIDNESLQKIGKWPWPRSIIAETSEKLLKEGQAKAVFVDVLYTEASQDHVQDEALARIAKTYNNFYLSSFFNFSKKQEITESLAYQSYHPPIIPVDDKQVGHINIFPDRDKVVRNISLGIPSEEGEIVPAISVRLANLQLNETNQISWNNDGEFFRGSQKIPTGERNEISFSYSTTPQDDAQQVVGNKFDTFSIHQVINGDLPPAYFENTIVLIGPYSVGLQDQYYTPMSKTTQMFGIEIHANIIQSFIDGTTYNKLPKSFGYLLIILITFVSFYLFDRIRAKLGLFLLLALFAIYILIVNIVFTMNQILLPFFYVLLALVIVYVTSVVSQYIIERREKAHVTSLFGRYVSKGVVDEILSTKEDVKLGGVRKDVTLVFVDIRGFTPLSEQMEPEEVIEILNEYLDLCTKAVFKFDGTLDKFIGYGVMAIFGAPIEQPDHAKRAIHAALTMKSQADELAARLQEKYNKVVQFGVGINSGPAVIGNIGSKDRLDYTAIGDTVNLAARLESQAKPGQILISSATSQLVADSFKLKPLDAIKVKGKANPVDIFEVEGEL